MSRSKTFSLLLASLLSTQLAGAATTQTPHIDVGFSEKTPLPDADLVVVRERFYGAQGIDLTAYGIGTGNTDYVQSIYVRFRKGTGGGSPAWFRERITFPPDVEVLAVISDGALLGGNADDGQLSQLDAIFGLDPMFADDYSSPGRGLEEDDFAFVSSSNDVFLLHSRITNDVDDVRILIDFGSSFPAESTFTVESPDVGLPSADPMSQGIRIGGSGGAIPGSGDGGEARSLVDIPLTGPGTWLARDGFHVSAISSIFFARNGDGTRLDIYDLAIGLPIPAVLRTTSPGNGTEFAQGPNNSLYCFAPGAGAGYFNIEARTATPDPLNEDLSGDITGASGDGGEESVWLVRDRSGNNNTKIDRVRASNMVLQESYTIDPALLPVPVGMVNGSDGRLYVLGQTGELVRFDPGSGLYSVAWNSGQTDYVEIGTNLRHSTLYLLRDAGPTSSIDLFDVASGVGQIDAGSLAERTPIDIVGGPLGTVCVIGAGDATQPERLWIADASILAFTDRISLDGLDGEIYGLSAFFPGGFGLNYCGPAVPNSGGGSAVIRASGDQTAGGDVVLSAWSLPQYQIGYFLVGQGSGTLFPVNGSDGRLCLLGDAVGRYNHPSQVMNTGALGRLFLGIDSSQLPMSPVTAAMPGETWNFQCWFRDNPNQTSHFTDATAVTFL
ncbi:MAG: hypothetical protein GY711_22340 [bacterium]|nr:hypothetical protein [bacterium]